MRKVYLQCKIDIMTRPLFVALQTRHPREEFQGYATVQHEQNSNTQWIIREPGDPGYSPDPKAPCFQIVHEETNGRLLFQLKGMALIVTKSGSAPFDAYEWRADNLRNGFFAFNNQDGTLVMDLSGGQPIPGTSVIAFPWNNGDNQMWQFIDRP